MKYIFNNFVNTLRHYVASSVLNIVGMAVAFAAFYIIMTQAMWGLSYNKDMEDVDRMYMMALSSTDGKDGSDVFCRPLAENMLANSSEVEAYGTAYFIDGMDATPLYLRDGDKYRKVKLEIQQFNQGALKAFGFEAEQGCFDDLSKPNGIAISSAFAQKNNLKLGDRLSMSATNDLDVYEIVAIWSDKFQPNSMPGRISALRDIKNMSIDDWS